MRNLDSKIFPTLFTFVIVMHNDSIIVQDTGTDGSSYPEKEFIFTCSDMPGQDGRYD